jgi:hypothetical protein
MGTSTTTMEVADVPDEQDRAEALDDDKGELPAEQPPGIDLIDQTADVDPGVAEDGRAVIDAGESGDDLDGTEGDPDNAQDPFHTEEPAPEVAAMHLTDEP